MLKAHVASYLTMTSEGKLCIPINIFRQLTLSYEIPVAFIQTILNHNRYLGHTSFGSRRQPSTPTCDLIQGRYLLHVDSNRKIRLTTDRLLVHTSNSSPDEVHRP